MAGIEIWLKQLLVVMIQNLLHTFLCNIRNILLFTGIVLFLNLFFTALCMVQQQQLLQFSLSSLSYFSFIYVLFKYYSWSVPAFYFQVISKWSLWFEIHIPAKFAPCCKFRMKSINCHWLSNSILISFMQLNMFAIAFKFFCICQWCNILVFNGGVAF